MKLFALLALLWHWRRVSNGWRTSARIHRWRQFVGDVERHPGRVKNVQMAYSLSINPPSDTGTATTLRLMEWKVR